MPQKLFRGGGALNNKNKTKRESGLELLRIIAMILIVMHHVSVHGKLYEFSNSGSKIINILGFGGKLGVNIFVLISAYFMVNKKFKITRILNIIFQTTFYSFIIFLFFCLSGKTSFTLKNVIIYLMPITFNQWWFVTIFVYLLLISPLLNMLMQSVNKKTLVIIILSLMFFIVLYPYIFRLILKEYITLSYYTPIFLFVLLYLLGGYVRLYGLKLKKIYTILILVFVFALGITLTVFGKRRELITTEYSIFNVLIALGLLLLFKDFKFKSKVINAIASTTFGIYLIHDNGFMRGWEYKFLANTFYSGITSGVLMFILLTITIFVFCMIIDFIRLQTIHRFTKKLLKFIDKKSDERKFKQQ